MTTTTQIATIARYVVGVAKKKLYTSKKWCYKRYVVERKTEREMAVEAETNQSTIHRWLVKHEII